MDLGFSKDRVALFEIGIKDSVRSSGQSRVSASQLLDLVRGIPAVQAAGLSEQWLIGGDFEWVMTPILRFPGREPEPLKPHYLQVSPGFFETMQIGILDGRDFAVRDMAPGSSAVVVNQEFVRQYLPNENPLGKQFEKTGDDGVVRDANSTISANRILRQCMRLGGALPARWKCAQRGILWL